MTCNCQRLVHPTAMTIMTANLHCQHTVGLRIVMETYLWVCLLGFFQNCLLEQERPMLSQGGLSHGLQPWGWMQRRDWTECPPRLISLGFLAVWLSRVSGCQDCLAVAGCALTPCAKINVSS